MHNAYTFLNFIYNKVTHIYQRLKTKHAKILIIQKNQIYHVTH